MSVWGHQKPCGSSNHLLQPTPVPSLNDCVGVSCGNNYTLAWTRNGRAFSWGSNLNGVLGHGTVSGGSVANPTLIKALENVNIVNMDAGFSHCGAITDEGKLYMWGRAKYGALGLGRDVTKNDVSLPCLVDGMVNLKALSCNKGENHGHTLAVSHSGDVYACGDGYKGKLGLGDQESRFTFTHLARDMFSGGAVSGVSSGGIHSACVCEGGRVWSWGCGSDGRLGHPEAEGHRYLFRSDVPRAVEGLGEGSAVKVSASYYHTVALVNSNDQ